MASTNGVPIPLAAYDSDRSGSPAAMEDQSLNNAAAVAANLVRNQQRASRPIGTPPVGPKAVNMEEIGPEEGM